MLPRSLSLEREALTRSRGVASGGGSARVFGSPGQLGHMGGLHGTHSCISIMVGLVKETENPQRDDETHQKADESEHNNKADEVDAEAIGYIVCSPASQKRLSALVVFHHPFNVVFSLTRCFF